MIMSAKSKEDSKGKKAGNCKKKIWKSAAFVVFKGKQLLINNKNVALNLLYNLK